MTIDLDGKDTLMYFYVNETEYLIRYIKIDIKSSTYIINTFQFEVPLDEVLIEGLYSEDKVIKNMTLEILKNKCIKNEKQKR